MSSSVGLSLLKAFGGGRSEDLETFLAKFKVVAKIQGWQTKEKRAEYLPLFLDKDAFTVWSQLDDSSRKDDTLIYEQLRSAFGSTKEEAYVKFVRRQLRTDETVDVYMADLRRLLRCSGHTEVSEDPVLKQQFLSGLPVEFAGQICLQNAASSLKICQCADQVKALRSAQRVTRQFPSSVSAAASSSNKGSSSTAVPSSVLCFHCKQSGHKRSLCPQLKGKCFHCKEKGHMLANCPKRSKQSTSAAKSGADTSVCLAVTATSSPCSLPRIYVDARQSEADDVHRLSAAVDSCSSNSLIAASAASAMDLHIMSDATQIVDVSGKAVQILGRVCVEVERSDEAVELPLTKADFLVVEHLSSVMADMIIGLNIISVHQGVHLEYSDVDNVLCGVRFGPQQSDLPTLSTAPVAAANKLPRHVGVTQDENVVRLSMDDGEAVFDPQRGYWEVEWKWKGGQQPTSSIGSGLGEYSRGKLTPSQEQKFRDEVAMWIDRGFMVPHDPAIHGEPAAVLPLLATCQEHKTSTPVRPCLDFRLLNNHILSHPGNDVPVCGEKLRDWRSKSTELSVVDIRKAYLNVRLHPSLFPYQTIVWQGKTYCMERMAFGLSVAPKLMDAIVKYSIREFPDADNFIDDIIVPSEQSESVSACLETYGLPTKPAVKLHEATVLGLKLSSASDGVRWQRRDITDIEAPQLATKRNVFQWCGKLTSHYPVCSWLRPLCSWLKRLASLVRGWDEPLPEELTRLCQEAMVRVLAEDPVRGVWNIPTAATWSVWCDASDIATGVAIGVGDQIVEDQAWLRKPNDRRHINIAELDAAIQGLALASKWNVQNPVLHTDSKTVYGWLTSLLDNLKRVKVSGLQQVLVERRLQIIEDLVATSDMIVKVVWVPSKQNLADQLTRVPERYMRYWKQQQQRETDASADSVATVATAAAISTSPVPLAETAAAQKNDPVIARVVAQLTAGEDVSVDAYCKVKSQLSVVDGVLIRTVKLPVNEEVSVPVIPSSLHERVLVAVHRVTGHAGWETMWQFLRSHCFMPNMSSLCQQFVKACGQCQAANPRRGPRAPPARAVIPSHPWEVVQIDTLELGGDDRFHCVLVCVDMFTKYAEVIPLRHHDGASVAQAVVSVCCRWGPPRVIRCDNGTEFVNVIVEALFTKFGVTVCHGAVRHPQSQGAAERFNRTLLTLIRKVLRESRDWRSDLDLLLHHYRVRPHSVTGISPMKAMCGWQPTNVIVESEQPSMSSSAWVDHLQQRSAQIRDHIEMELSKEDPVPSDAFECPYSIDTPVMLRRPTRHQKCLSPYEGGWLIKSVISPSTVVIIRTDGSGEKVINIDLLKYDPAADVCADDSCASVPPDNDLDDCVVLLPLHEPAAVQPGPVLRNRADLQQPVRFR